MRSLLIVRGDDDAALAAALASEADAIVVALDVAEAREAARAVAARILGAAQRSSARGVLMARVSALCSGKTERDLDAAMAFSPTAILLPRCAGAPHVQALSVKLAVREARLGLMEGATGIVAVIDAAEAALAAPGLRAASARLIGVAWDAQALSADVGAWASHDETGGYTGSLRLGRDLTLMAAAAARVPAIDAACPSAADALWAEAVAARRDGFAAKFARDPAQAALINEVFGAPRGL
jgi:citrate lyase subunit beta / citryl-CoA lyase